MKIEFYKHNVGEKEKQLVLECLDGLFLTTGSYVTDFEEKFSAYLGMQHTITVMSCTAALHLALLGLDIGPGDEVITTPQTFIATATAALHAGATVVFADAEPSTGLIDPEEVVRKITPRTKAIIPVHLYGQMCDMIRLREIADQHGLKIIEDSAHCIEAVRDGIRPGQLGDAAAFSYYATKNITSGEGGAIGTNSDELAERLLPLRLHGMTKDAASRYHGEYKHWDMTMLGWKANLSNIQAAMLLPQLERIDNTWEGRKKVYDLYMKHLADVPQIQIPAIHPNSKSAHHLFTILAPLGARDGLLAHLGKHEIGVAVNYRAIHLLTYFQQLMHLPVGSFPNAEDIGNRTISLPFYVGLEEEKIIYIKETIQNFFKENHS